jgi:hypothetical protein
MTSLDGLNPDFRDMVAMLCDEGAEFLVVGAYAVSFRGHARTTGDMDLLVRPTAANAARVWRALVVANKKAAHRPKDLLDVAELEKMKERKKGK